MNYQIKTLSLKVLDPSPTNPRKKFNPEKLEELAASIREQGVLIPLLVRPLKGGKRFEIVAGERRYRAAQLVDQEEVPCHVREMDDSAVLEAQMIENLQRDDLDPLEEAQGFRLMLDLKGPSGEEMYSTKSVAAKVGKSTRYIQRRLKLLNLPDSARKALDEGTIGAAVCELIGRIPDKRLREKATKEVIEPKYYDRPLTFRETEALIERHYMRTLEKSSFDQEDKSLHPEGLQCSTCPHRAANHPDAETVRGDMCLNPVCFERKSKLAYERWQRKHEGEGKKVLSASESEKYVTGDSIVSWSCNLVVLDKIPDSHLLPASNAGNNVGTWRELVAGRGVEVVIARMDDDEALECADRVKAMEAARLNGHKIFRTTTKEERGSYEEQRKREMQERGEFFIALLKAVPGKAGGDMEKWMRLLVVSMVGACGERVLTARAMTSVRSLEAVVMSSKGVDLCDLAAQVLLASEVNWAEQLTAESKRVLKELDLTPAKIKRGMEAEKKEAAAAAKKKEKKPK